MGTADLHSDDPWSGRPGGRDWRREARRTSNPLLRRPTPVEWRVRRIGLALLALVALAIVLGCLHTYRCGVAAERAGADRRPVKVTVVRQVQSTGAYRTYAPDVVLEVTYQVDGVVRTGIMPGPIGSAVGAELDAWVDQEGKLVPRPQTHPATLVQTGLAAVAGGVFLIGLMIGGRAGLAAWTMRLRAQEWEAEWLAFDTGRGRR